jgi:hypothetical protein
MSKITDKQIDEIYDTIDDLAKNKFFGYIDAVLEAAINLDEDRRLTYLVATYPCKSKLPNRPALLKSLAHDPKLIEGLE